MTSIQGGWLPSMHHRSYDQAGLQPGGWFLHSRGGDLHPGGGGSASRKVLHLGVRGSAYSGGWTNPLTPAGPGKTGGTHPTGMLPCIVWIVTCCGSLRMSSSLNYLNLICKIRSTSSLLVERNYFCSRSNSHHDNREYVSVLLDSLWVATTFYLKAVACSPKSWISLSSICSWDNYLRYFFVQVQLGYSGHTLYISSSQSWESF